jgi:ASC-1-like (ASCH) protein
MEIKKKVWPEYFELIKKGKKKFELRLADFKVKKGDTLILEEYNSKTKKYTGRTMKKKVKSLIKINPVKMYPLKDIKKHGFYIMEI